MGPARPLAPHPAATKALLKPSASIHASVITYWEISLKAGLGKLSLTGVAPEDYPTLTHDAGWAMLPLAPEIAVSAGALPRLPDHRDPFDRLLIWTAIRENLTLVSGDRALSAYSPHGLKLCW